MVSDATEFTGSTERDTSGPDGLPRKLLDVSTLRNSGWQPTIPLLDGIHDTVA